MYITISDVRFYIMDRGSEDNPYLLDLAYSDEEISGAMRSAAREYNSVPPLGVETVHPGHLPADTNLFLDGTTAALLRMELLRRGRNNVDYSLGGASASTESTRLARIEAEQKIMHERFKEAASVRKLTINMSSYFGPII